jgi:hypothetical protein
MPNSEAEGDMLNLILNIFPAYSLGAVIFFNAMGDILYEYRKSTEGNGSEISNRHWDINNTTANVIGLLCHFVIWTLVLIVIEAGLGKKI